MIRPAAGMPRPRGFASCHALLPNVALSAAKWHPHASLTAASLTPVQAVALEAELRVNRQRLAAAPKNAARAEIELERRADLQFLRMQNDQARRRRGVAAALRMSVLCGAVRCSGWSRGSGVGLGSYGRTTRRCSRRRGKWKSSSTLPGLRSSNGRRRSESKVRGAPLAMVPAGAQRLLEQAPALVRWLRWGGACSTRLLSPLCTAIAIALMTDGTGVCWVAFQCEQNRLFQAEGQRNQFRARHAPQQAAHTSAFR